DKAGLENIALSTRIMSVQGCTNICKEAFDYAKKTGRKRVTLIEKPNVLRETGGLMMRCFRDVAKDYPDIWADEVNIDAICKLMFDWLKETEMATRLEAAIARVIAEGKVRTYDMGGNAFTLDVAKAVANYAAS